MISFPGSRAPWLLLIHQLPAKPAYLRVKVWRRLQAIGATPLKNAVHALPLRDDTAALFDDLLREITEGGGEAIILEAALVGGLGDADVRALFDAVRDSDYEDLAREARTIDDGQVAREIVRLRARLAEIAAIDYFGAHGRQAAEAALADLVTRSTRHPDVSSTCQAVIVTADLRQRVWVTRRGIHVDRIASAWLIRRFIDPEATFKFVDGQGYEPAADELRFDMANAEFTHEGERCTFETLLVRTQLDNDTALVAIGEIIHDLDIADSRFNRPETAGLGALIAGICARTDDDNERLAEGTAALEQFYAYFSRGRKA